MAEICRISPQWLEFDALSGLQRNDRADGFPPNFSSGMPITAASAIETVRDRAGRKLADANPTFARHLPRTATERNRDKRAPFILRSDKLEENKSS
jgi:hypothetical protein